MEGERSKAPGAADARPVELTLRLPAVAVSTLLRGEAESIARERAALASEVAGFEALKARVAVAHFPTYVKLDVGGQVFKTSVSTLRAERGTVLDAMFSGSGFEVTPNEDGAYFIDRDGTHFRLVLNYLRGCFDASLVEAETVVRRELLMEADFYGLQGLVHALLAKPMPFNVASSHENGFLYWLGTTRGAKRPAWSNPALSGAVRVTATSTKCDKMNLPGMVERGTPAAVSKEQAGPFLGGHLCCEPQPGAHILIELLDGMSIEPTHYSLRYSPTNYCTESPGCCKWTLEGAARLEGPFVVLKEHTDGGLQTAFTAWALDVSPPRACSVFRLAVQKGCLHAACFEIYGTALVR